MKILDIIKENDELIMERWPQKSGSSDETQSGGLLGWLKKKFTTDPIADKIRHGHRARRAREGDPTTSAVAKTDQASTPMDAGEFAGTPGAKTKKAPLPNTPPPGTAVAAKGPNTPPPGTAVAVKLPNTPPPGTAVAKTDQEAYAGDPSAVQDAGSGDQEAYAGDPSVLDDTIARIKANAGMKDSEYKTSQGSKRTARDMALDKQYPYKAPDGRRLKYPHGDLRNLFEPSPDTRKAGSDVVVRDGKRKKSWKNPNTSTSQNAFRSDDDRK